MTSFFELSNPQVSRFSYADHTPTSAAVTVASAGDFNDDGFDDVIIGAPYSIEAIYGGAAFLVFGTGATGENLELGTLGSLNGTRGFRMTGRSLLGHSASAGDFNKDGINDILISANQETYILFGTRNTAVFGEDFDLRTMGETQGVIIATSGDIPPRVANAGDFNNDGFDDIIMGITKSYDGETGNYVNVEGSSYVLYGPFLGGSLDLSTLTSSQGFKINGAPDYAIGFVSSAGDFNNDGFDDIIIGARPQQSYDYEDDDAPGLPAVSFVVYGKSGPLVLELPTLSSSQGFRIIGTMLGDFAGHTFASTDFNNDGFSDLIIGEALAAPADMTEATLDNAVGAVFVVYGASTISLAGGALELSTLSSNRGFRMDGSGDGSLLGYSVASAGDLNKDGFGDVIIGVIHHFSMTSSVGFVIYGTNSNFAGKLDLAQLTSSQGYSITQNEPIDPHPHDQDDYNQDYQDDYNQDEPTRKSRFCVASAGDFNQDGNADLVIGAFWGWDENWDGFTSIIFGTAQAPTPQSSNQPTSTFKPTTRMPTERPTRTPTREPTTRSPSLQPTTRVPTEKPTRKPTQDPATTRSPSLQPTTRVPTEKPTRKPTLNPTSRSPSLQPTTRVPTEKPTRKPTLNPTTRSPSLQPTTRVPTEKPTRKPTLNPTTRSPTLQPTTRVPTEKPTRKPTLNPTTRSPTNKPTTRIPTEKPTRKPTLNPTTRSPTIKPTTRTPTEKPTSKPTQEPTTRIPTNKPTTRIPTEKPTRKPTPEPTTRSPTNKPTTRSPTVRPTTSLPP